MALRKIINSNREEEWKEQKNNPKSFYELLGENWRWTILYAIILIIFIIILLKFFIG
jgi:hypothetical protein